MFDLLGLTDRTPDSGVDSSSARLSFAEMLAARAEQPLAIMAEPAAALLLLGDAGSGKTYLAEHVARTMEQQSPEKIRAFLFPQPPAPENGPAAVFGELFPEIAGLSEPSEGGAAAGSCDSARIADEILETAQTAAGSAEPILVFPGVDRYSSRATAILEQIIRRRRFRVIATARRMTSGANQMSRDSFVTRLVVGPLDIREADALLSSMLWNSRLALPTLRRWHALTGGNSHALVLMLMANERAGTLRRLRRLAYVAPGEDEIPEELARHARETCDDVEHEALMMLSLAEPVFEPPLLRLLDPRATGSLIDRGLVSMRPGEHGHSVLRISRPILASAVRSRMSPAKRAELTSAFYYALTEAESEEDFSPTSPHLLKAVEFGLQCGAHIPQEWLVEAVSRLTSEANPQLMLKVSLALASSDTSEDAVAAAVRSLALAMQLGDPSAAGRSYRRIDEFFEDRALYDSLPSMLRNRLRLAQIEHHFWTGSPMESVLAELDDFEAALGPDEIASREATRAMRFKLLMRDGQFAAAAEHPIDLVPSPSIVVEWVRAPARSMSALLLQQQGKIDEAIRIAARARDLSLNGHRPLNDALELQGFYWFAGYWADGCAENARDALQELEADAEAKHQTGPQFSELIETGWALLALQEARWKDAADIVELVRESAPRGDRYGLSALLSAVAALALAALGDRDAAAASLRGARLHRRGLSQSMAGYRRRIALRAQQWLRLGDVDADAMSFAAWAQEQGLGLIEMQALHIAVSESPRRAGQVLERARWLAEEVDPVVAEVILSHLEKIAAGASPTDVSEPEVRLLADLGLWMPLPGTSRLSAREREIALLASLGYSSRVIAERFHLSIRTVETHLAHVYVKLGIEDRAELRQWFSSDRRVAEDAPYSRSSA